METQDAEQACTPGRYFTCSLRESQDDRTTVLTTSSANTDSMASWRSTTSSSSQNIPKAIDNEFLDSESLYLAALETLWIAYIQPLINAAPEHAAEASSITLIEKFGADVLQMIACHKLIMSQIRNNSLLLNNDEDNLAVTEESADDCISPMNAPDDCPAVSSNAEDIMEGVAFPLVLLRMAPSMCFAYTNYVTNFRTNLEAAEAARQSVPHKLWSSSYVSLAQATLKEKLRPMLMDPKSSVPSLYLTFDCSFAALVTLPVQRIARYSLLISEWVKCHAEEEDHQAPPPFASPFKRAQLVQHAQAVEATVRLQGICASVNHIQAVLENTRRLIEMEQRFGVRSCSLSQHADMRLLQESPLIKAKPKGRGIWHYKPCYAMLFERLLVIIESFDRERRKCKRILRIPLCAVESIRSINASPALRKELYDAHQQEHAKEATFGGGFLLRYVAPNKKKKSKSHHFTTDSNGGESNFFFDRWNTQRDTAAGATPVQATESSFVVEELVLIDEDEMDSSLWVSEISQGVSRAMDGS